MPESNTPVPAKQAAANGLAIVGFIALIVFGLFLAVSASRFVPDVVNGLGSAAVYLGSVFNPSSDTAAPTSSSTPSVIGTTTPVISFGTPTTTAPTPAPRRPVSRGPGRETSGTYQIGGSATSTVALSGLPDLITTIDAIGYLTGPSADTFVATSTVPNGSRPAVRFTIKNIGTNQTGPWRFSATIPTQTSFLYQSQPQQPLLPGDSIQYTLGFDQANPGARQMVSVTANFDKGITESNYDNDSASAYLTIIGG